MTEGHISWDVTKSLFVSNCRDSSLWLKPTVFEMSQRGYMQPITATVQYGWRTQYLRCHKESICDLLLRQFIMTEGHSIWDVTMRLFVTYCWHSLLWLKATVFEMLQRGYLQPIAADTVHYDWWPQYLRCHREAICNLFLPQFTVAEGHSIWVFKHR